MRELELPEGGLPGHPQAEGGAGLGTESSPGSQHPAPACATVVSGWADSLLSLGLSFPTRASSAGGWCGITGCMARRVPPPFPPALHDEGHSVDPGSLIASLGNTTGILSVVKIPWWYPGVSRPEPQFPHLYSGVVIPTLPGRGAQTLGFLSQLSTA